MVILGVDPSSKSTGYGLIKVEKGGINHIRSGTIVPQTHLAFYRLLQVIHDKIEEIIIQHAPEIVALESIFFHKNPKTTIMMGHIRGVILLICSMYNISIAEYSPLEVKQALVGYGRATKHQVSEMVRHFLNIGPIRSNDASDALAIAICHFHSAHMKSLGLR
ncbi:MAG: crossover junction endodeoxyribonuclease RuvC [Thermodesulfobacteriota bacterium]|nr:crossover junction endodeoxyribonuclease RuvC [Thermodesulfobacteriota bacterium]